eukprot:jgi/Tetstr1/429393/TSEL_019305.t1
MGAKAAALLSVISKARRGEGGVNRQDILNELLF